MPLNIKWKRRKNVQVSQTKTNYQLFIPYFAPYIAYITLASFKNVFPIEWNYALRIVIAVAMLSWFWRWYVPLTGPRSAVGSIFLGIIVGLLGTFIWILMLIPFVLKIETGWNNSAFLMRLTAASFVVPFIEELLIRGYLFRIAYQWDLERKKRKQGVVNRVIHKLCVNDVKPGAWTAMAVLLSTLAFTVGHNVQEWSAAFVYGLLMTILWIVRKDLLSCIVAHGTTNLTLAVYVFATESWQFW